MAAVFSLSNGFTLPAYLLFFLMPGLAWLGALTFMRSTWGNQGGAIEAQAVNKLRERTDPASSSPIILQMR